MIKITKHTSNICGCVTWYEWDTDQAEGSRVHTDVAVSPCAIHDPANFGKTLIVNTLNTVSIQLIGQSSVNPVEIVSDVRPSQIKDIVPLSISITARKEMYLQEETRAVLLKVPEISEDELDEKGNILGRKFKEAIEVNFDFNEDRKMVVGIDGAKISEKQALETALNNSDLDKSLIIIS